MNVPAMSLPGAEPLPLTPGLYPARFWPANILRLHLVFPQAIDAGDSAQPVRLFDAAGRERLDVFADIPGGLWSACGRILTVLLHPGRVKRGLAARDRLGPGLVAGETVTLTLSSALRGADGGPHGLPERFLIRIAPPVFGPIPSVAFRRTGHGLRLGGPAPIDALGALSYIRLIAPDGAALFGRLAPLTGWALHLSPSHAPCPHFRFEIVAALEDCCGNRRDAGFEVLAASSAMPPTVTGDLPCLTTSPN
ncbi:hypothetical protein [Pannonibacter sp. SL95]|uniref:hypothetical protein n=1 Tax=Pannonibacter sp. SL95 TaxID=2995153 RepID=UPI002274EBA5|nr:hypothetical protein [Pannonibacter sp. SL95]MCY1707275.1 hypothetical protein [Pannonibacter sp. SL95]